MFASLSKYRYIRKKIFISFVSFLLAVSLILGVLPITVSAEDEVIKVAVVTYTRLALREGPGASYPQIKSPISGANLYVSKGDQLVVLAEEINDKKQKWYKVPCSSAATGYAYVYDDEYENFEKIHTIAREEAFEAYLTEQGFPESYKDDLRILHYFYPKWEFVSVKNNLDWQKSVDAEYVLGVSLVEKSVISSWKSTQTGAYDWKTSTWTSFDYGLHAASREIIAYYLDPRNSLGSNSIFQFLGQAFDESQTLEGLRSMVGNTFLKNTVTDTDDTQLDYPAVIYDLAKQNGVNPYIIASIITQEVGVNGTSGSVSGTYEGYENYFNYFNIMAYAHDGRGAIENGLRYASNIGGTLGSYGRPWNTRRKALNGGIEWYKTNYVRTDTSSLYTKKFNIIIDGSGNYRSSYQYMTNIDGAASEANRLSSAYPEDVKKNQVLKFYIPVYENMPETACKRPVIKGSPNNRLSSISVAGYTIGPVFDMNTLEYSLIVPAEVDKVTVSATAYDSTAKIGGVGEVSLNFGVNTVKIPVTAENGDVRTYNLIISREASDVDPEFKLPYMETDGIISKINPETSVSDIIKSLDVKNGKAEVAGKTESDIVGTGDVITVNRLDGTVFKSYTVLIRGDVSGDGKIQINDIIKIRNHLLNSSVLSGVQALSADVSGDGEIQINDIIKIRNHLLGTVLITQ